MDAERNTNGKRLHTQHDGDDIARSKKREFVDEEDLRTKETVYRYLCPERKVGSIIGKGGDIVRQIRNDSKAKVTIGDIIRGCEERIVTLSSLSPEADAFEDESDYVCAAQDALFRVHEILVRKEVPDDEDMDIDASTASARLLLPADQVGHIIGKGGQMINSLRNATGANIRVLKDGHVPLCANRDDEVLEITGEATQVKEALRQVSSRLHSASRSQHPSTSHSQVKVHEQTRQYNRHSSVDDTDNGGNHIRSYDDERTFPIHGADDTFYRYLFPERKVGSLIGKGGEIVKQMRADSRAKIIVGGKIAGCEERAITIFSSSEKTNTYQDMRDHVCPAQDALLRVHERLEAAETLEKEHHDTGAPLAIVRLLVPTDQIGHVIGKGGHVINDIKSETCAHIRILKDEHLPCANSNDEILQITGEASDVKKALYRVSCCLYNRTSRLVNLSVPNGSQANRHRYESESVHVRDRVAYTNSPKDFGLCLLCASSNIGAVIGKGGAIINQIRQESRAAIKVDSSSAEDDCIILISAKEFSADPVTSVIDAAVQLQPRCCDIISEGSGNINITRILVPESEIGSFIGKGGSSINEIRKATRASIRIMSKESLPKVASEDDILVEISGDPESVKCALIEVARRLGSICSRRESIRSEHGERY